MQHVVGRSGVTEGAGFLLHGPDLSPTLSAEKSYVLMNAHVLWDRDLNGGDGRDRAELDPKNSRLPFDGGAADPGAETFGAGRVLWQSPRGALDAVLLELPRRVDPVIAVPLRLADLARKPVVGGETAEERLAIIGHPSGGPMALSTAGTLHETKAGLVDGRVWPWRRRAGRQGLASLG